MRSGDSTGTTKLVQYTTIFKSCIVNLLTIRDKNMSKVSPGCRMQP